MYKYKILIFLLLLSQGYIFSQPEPHSTVKVIFGDKKELIKALKIKSKSMFVYVNINGEWSASKERNLLESCYYDTNGNKIEDYYFSFNGKFYRNNYTYSNEKLLQTSTSELGSEALVFVDYGYDDKGRVEKEVRSFKNDTSLIVSEYSYNSSNYLIGETKHGQSLMRYNYIYDSLGNVINTIVDNSFEKIHNYNKVLKYNANSLLLEIKYYSDGILKNEESFKYDTNGNMIEKNYHSIDEHRYQKQLYEYDEKGNAISFIGYNGNSMDFNQRYKYDINGLLIERTNLNSMGNPLSIYKYVYEYYN